MYKITINARFLTQSVTGVQRYAIELVKALDCLIENGLIDSRRYSFILLAPMNTQVELNLKHIPLKKVGKLKGHLWEQLELPLYTSGRFLVNLCNVAPLFKKNQIVTIHDAAVFAIPHAYSFSFRVWYNMLLKVIGKISKRVITDSLFSKKELIRYCRINETKLNVVYLGYEHMRNTLSDPSIIRKYGLNEKPFILAVSSINPNKNFHSILRAIELLGDINFDIVFVGGNNLKIFNKSKSTLLKGIKYLGYVSDAELKALYEHTTCFIYPSFYEGFGLPPLEAMACGSPVIVSNTASLPEVCGDSALYCNPYSPEDIANSIQKLMNNSILREKLRQRGLEHVKGFSWEKCAQEMFNIVKGELSS
jgi:glycosyltransferase involved in cell wall biosynthesis